MTERIISEGTTGVIEGVHILPGMLQHLSSEVIEILINPDDETHKAMFTSKLSAAKLRTVSEDFETREREYESTRAIQDYMISLAQDSNIPIVDMMNFEEATNEIYEIIVGSVRTLVADFEGAS